MNVSYFIGISSTVLLTWLGVTYFHQVPHESYPKHGRLSSVTTETTPILVIDGAASATVSVSITE